MSIPRLGACLLFLFAMACGDEPLAPGALTGVWTLASVDRHPVPTTVRSTADSSVLMASDTLRLADDGSFTGTRCELRIDHLQQAATTVCGHYRGEFHVRVRAIELRYGCLLLESDCSGYASSGVIATGTLRQDRLVLRTHSAAPELEYARSP